MRVLYIAHSTGKEGSNVALLNLIKGLKGKNVEIGVMLPRKDGYLYDMLNKLNIPIFFRREYPSVMGYATNGMGSIQKMKWIYRYSRVILGIKRDVYGVMREFKPDLVHTNTSAIDYALLGCVLTRTPHVWHVRELIKEGVFVDVFPSLRILKWKMRIPLTHNIAVTQIVYDYYKMSSKDTVIYDGVIKESDNVGNTQQIKYPYFLSVGYVNKIKGTLYLIEQFAVFARKNKEIHLLIAGDYFSGDKYYEKCIETIRRNNLEDRVLFLGRRDDIYNLMKSAKTLFVCSRFEGFGFTSVEAMYCGTLVVGRNVGGIKEQFDIGVRETGFEIGLRYTNDEELPALMERALVEDFTEMKMRAKKFVESRYTIQRHVDEVYAFYGSILQKTCSVNAILE